MGNLVVLVISGHYPHPLGAGNNPFKVNVARLVVGRIDVGNVLRDQLHPAVTHRERMFMNTECVLNQIHGSPSSLKCLPLVPRNATRVPKKRAANHCRFQEGSLQKPSVENAV